jgi:acrylyl-CoA reductase (NADPH)
MDFPATVAPFILRGVTLAGIDSVMAPIAKREAAWTLLAKHVPAERLAQITREIPLAEAFDVAREILAGRLRGRVVVDVRR